MLLDCFSWVMLKSLSTKEKVGAVSCVNVVHTNTINEPYTFEQALTHLLILVCWFLFINLSCHLLEATPQQEGPSREATLCSLPLPPAPTLPDSFAPLAFQRRLERHICLETDETILSSCQRKRADILRTVCKCVRTLVCADVRVCANVCE